MLPLGILAISLEVIGIVYLQMSKEFALLCTEISLSVLYLVLATMSASKWQVTGLQLWLKYPALRFKYNIGPNC